MDDVRVNDLVELELNGSRVRGTVLRLKERAGVTLAEVAVAGQCNLWVQVEALLTVSRPVDCPVETPAETTEATHGTTSESAAPAGAYATVGTSEEVPITATTVVSMDVMPLHWYASVNGIPCKVISIRDDHTALVSYDDSAAVSTVDWVDLR